MGWLAAHELINCSCNSSEDICIAYTSSCHRKEPEIKRYVTWLTQLQQQQKETNSELSSLSPALPLPKDHRRRFCCCFAEGFAPRLACLCKQPRSSRADSSGFRVTDRSVVGRLTALAEAAALQTLKLVHAGGLCVLLINYFLCEAP